MLWFRAIRTITLGEDQLEAVDAQVSVQVTNQANVQATGQVNAQARHKIPGWRLG